MFFAALVLLCSLPQAELAAKFVYDQPPVVASAQEFGAASSPSLPSMPLPKNTPAIGDFTIHAVAERSEFLPEPVKPILRKTRETRTPSKIWLGLAIAGHTGAAFDAWSTRRALSGNYGRESDPLMRPFAHSGVLYAATQVSPLILDYLGKRAMSSERPWIRRIWWLPQATGASFSFVAGARNVNVVR